MFVSRGCLAYAAGNAPTDCFRMCGLCAGTSISADKALLGKQGKEVGDLLRLAVQYRMRKKQVLADVLQLLGGAAL